MNEILVVTALLAIPPLASLAQSTVAVTIDIFKEGNYLLNQSSQVNYGYTVPDISFMRGICQRFSTY
jgi:hypothetical protein